MTKHQILFNRLLIDKRKEIILSEIESHFSLTSQLQENIITTLKEFCRNHNYSAKEIADLLTVRCLSPEYMSELGVDHYSFSLVDEYNTFVRNQHFLSGVPDKKAYVSKSNLKDILLDAMKHLKITLNRDIDGDYHTEYRVDDLHVCISFDLGGRVKRLRYSCDVYEGKMKLNSHPVSMYSVLGLSWQTFSEGVCIDMKDDYRDALISHIDFFHNSFFPQILSSYKSSS